MTLRRNRNSPTIIIRKHQPSHEPQLHRVQPDRATPRKLLRRSSTATVITHSQNIR